MKKPAKPTEASRFTQAFNRLRIKRNDLMSRMTVKRLVANADIALLTAPLSWVDRYLDNSHGKNAYKGSPCLLTFTDSSIAYCNANDETCKQYLSASDASMEQFGVASLFLSTNHGMPELSPQLLLEGVRALVVFPHRNLVVDFPEMFARHYHRRSWMKVDEAEQFHALSVSDMAIWCPSFDYQEYEQRATLIKAMYGDSDPDLDLMKQIVIDVAELSSHPVGQG